jgi:hypothetical protein
MDDAAVEGVLAHEVAHITNGDMVTMTLPGRKSIDLRGMINADFRHFRHPCGTGQSVHTVNQLLFLIAEAPFACRGFFRFIAADG